MLFIIFILIFQYTVEQLECLAQWKDGSLHYLMGRLQYQGATSDEDRYRCFVYEKIQAPPSSAALSPAVVLMPSATSTAVAPPPERHRITILVAQSGDATCSGLTSPNEGSRTLRLTKGIYFYFIYFFKFFIYPTRKRNQKRQNDGSIEMSVYMQQQFILISIPPLSPCFR